MLKLRVKKTHGNTAHLLSLQNYHFSLFGQKSDFIFSIFIYASSYIQI